jgi:hypothetical protein
VVEEAMSLLLQKPELTVCASGVCDELLWNEVLREESGVVAR